MIFAYFIYFKSLSVLSLRLCLELFFSHYWTEPCFEPTSCRKEPFPAAMVAGFTIRRLPIGKKFHLSISGSAEVIPKTFSCYLPCRLRVVPHLSPGIASETRARVKITPREKRLYAARPRLSFLTWGDFHARSRFAGSTIHEEKWGTTRSLSTMLSSSICFKKS